MKKQLIVLSALFVAFTAQCGVLDDMKAKATALLNKAKTAVQPAKTTAQPATIEIPKSSGPQQVSSAMRDQRIKASEAIKLLVAVAPQRLRLPDAYAGTPENNPILWIIQNASDKQLDLLERMNKERRDFHLGADDSAAFNGLPPHVKVYIRFAFQLLSL
jgi:hypothetical protein